MWVAKGALNNTRYKKNHFQDVKTSKVSRDLFENQNELLIISEIGNGK